MKLVVIAILIAPWVYEQWRGGGKNSIVHLLFHRHTIFVFVVAKTDHQQAQEKNKRAIQYAATITNSKLLFLDFYFLLEGAAR